MDNVSFLPEDYLESQIHRRTNLNCLTLFVIVMGGVVGAFLMTNQQRSDVRRQQFQVDSDFDSAANRLEQLAQLQQRKDRMLRKAKITAVLLETIPRSNVLAELINNMPPSVTVVELDLATKIDKVKRAKARTSLDIAKAKAIRKSKWGGKRKNQLPALPVEKAPAPTKVLITLTGTAPTDVDVADYMTALGNSVLFEKVNLQFSEQIVIEDSSLRKFKVEMVLNQDLPIGAFEPMMVKRDLGRNPIKGAPLVSGPETTPITTTVLPATHTGTEQEGGD